MKQKKGSITFCVGTGKSPAGTTDGFVSLHFFHLSGYGRKSQKKWFGVSVLAGSLKKNNLAFPSWPEASKK
jgi:hypothetical protein